LRNGTLFIVHSAEDEKNLIAILPEAIVEKSLHPTYDIFNMEDFDNRNIRSRCGIEGNVLLFFGFVREYKGLKYLIEALPEILSKVKVTLLIVGEFWEDKDAYVRLINNYGLKDDIIVIDRYVSNEEIGDYFRAADLVVQPYISATGSGVIMSAFAFNKPVVATNVGCLPQVVEDGKTGYLVAPKAPHELAQAIIKFFQENKMGDFSKNIKERKEYFSWERLSDVIEDLTLRAPS
jgi:glycosyltransferase involved in cell wall biosynthesis